MITLYNKVGHVLHINVQKCGTEVLEDFSRATLKVFLVGYYKGRDDKFPVAYSLIDKNCICVDVPANTPPGVYDVELLWFKDDEKHARHHIHRDKMAFAEKRNAFCLSEDPDEETRKCKTTLRIRMSAATYGYDGLDAYDLAVLRDETNDSLSGWLSSLPIHKDAIDTDMIRNGAVTIEKTTFMPQVLEHLDDAVYMEEEGEEYYEPDYDEVLIQRIEALEERFNRQTASCYLGAFTTMTAVKNYFDEYLYDADAEKYVNAKGCWLVYVGEEVTVNNQAVKSGDLLSFHTSGVATWDEVLAGVFVQHPASTELYLRVDPQVVWADMQGAGYFGVESNTDWNINDK